MSEAKKTIYRVMDGLLERREDGAPTFSSDSRFFEDLDMDSLEVAELSAALEDELGTDPFSQGLLPSTLADLIAFYES